MAVLLGEFFGGRKAFNGRRLGDFSLAEFAAEAPLQFRRYVRNLHAGDHEKFAGQHGARGVVVGELADDFAVLALLIPAEAAVGNRFGADVLEGAEKAVFLRDVEGAAEDGDRNEPLVGTKDVGHEGRLSSSPKREVSTLERTQARSNNSGGGNSNKTTVTIGEPRKESGGEKSSNTEGTEKRRTRSGAHRRDGTQQYK
jgi:hypothetical protein